jgi:hypothetical protein
MNIAYVMAEGRGDTDLLLADLADRLIAGGTRLCGTVQINTDRPDTHRCDMDVRWRRPRRDWRKARIC